jgi:hypothetical protein
MTGYIFQKENKWMMVIILSFIICHLSFSPVRAQTFTQRLQQKGNGQGTVTIHQDAEIDKLVNSEMLNANPAQHNSPTTTPTVSSGSSTGKNTSTTKPTAPSVSSTGEDVETEETTPDFSKKVMRGGVKVNGYRVQAFAGGNSRKDRQEAEATGNAIKSHFADVPVYVHFYSPRWICRVGNYRTYEEAHQMLVQLRNLGYSQASIVKGKITVQY